MNANRNTNTITTKQRKTQQKVTRLQKANDNIILKYGCYANLKQQRNLFRRSRLEKYRCAHNDYHTFYRHKKFIENNFELVQHSHRNNSGSSHVVVGNENNFLGERNHHLTETNDNNDLDNVVTATNRNQNSNMTPPLVQNIVDNEDNALDLEANVETVNNNINLNLNGDRSANNAISDEISFIDENRRLGLDESLDMICANCHRTQSINLVEHYGECYRLSFYR